MLKLVKVVFLFIVILNFCESFPTETIHPQSSPVSKSESKISDGMTEMTDEDLRAKRDHHHHHDHHDDYILEKRYGHQNHYYLIVIFVFYFDIYHLIQFHRCQAFITNG
ncbi:CLUMA_CG013112, isoform A [Clunio marinus]|uniref:CLUMA_CG013112, isoform A n=1 Tax=Clunio marinus TaxID=568069 RepID=A0A1J1IJT6_9DIPT|nr:CLUMA_CG013112, isoform A [Clunio marinus]